MKPGAGMNAVYLPLAIAGHSFGAYTAQLFAGAEIDRPDGPRRFHDPHLIQRARCCHSIPFGLDSPL